MNLYEEHYEILKKYKEANKNYNKVLEKKALLVLKNATRSSRHNKRNS